MFSGFRSLQIRTLFVNLTSFCHHRDSDDKPIHYIKLMQMLQGKQQLGAVKPSTFFVEAGLPLQVVEKFSSVDKAEYRWWSTYGYPGKQLQRTHAKTRYNFCSDWKLNLSGTMNGLLTLAKTRRSASVWVISPRSTICCFLMVLSA